MPSFSAVLFVTTTKRAVRCTQDIQRTAGLSCDRKTVEYTHDKRCDKFCDGRACSDVWDSTLHSAIPGHRDVNVLRLFGHSPLQTRSATLTAMANAGCPRSVRTPAEKSVTVEITWYCISMGVSIQESPMYLLTINWIHTITRGEHICLQILVLYAYSTCHQEAAMVTSLDKWRVFRKIIISGHMLWNIFELWFNKESHYGQLVCSLSYHFYIGILESLLTFSSGNNRPIRSHL